MENETSSSQKQIIAGVVYSTFEREGPIPKICFPKTMPEEKQLTIAMKSISLLMGESVYQEGNELESIKYFGILPYPDLNLTGLTYFFLIQDVNARGKAMAATICLLIDEKFSSFIYENMKDLSVFFVDAAQSITSETTYLESKEIIQTFKDKIENYIAEIQTPITTDRQIKILFTGLDASGKTSFLRAIKQKYSELTGITPTKGISRTNEILLGQRLMEWDCGGQLKYRRNFLKHAELYLFETNLMHFLIDTRDEERFDDALSFFKDIIKIFKEFKQYPPIIINFHKVDPDIEEDKDLIKKIKKYEQYFNHAAPEFHLKFFKTSIFNAYSLNKSFSEGISALSPNKDILRGQLHWLSSEINAQAILLLNENNIILSDFAENPISGQLSEMTAPHFKHLYKTFAEFKILKRKNVVWRMEDEIISFYRILTNKESIYLLCLFKNQESILKKLKKMLPEFKKRIEPLIENYL